MKVKLFIFSILISLQHLSAIISCIPNVVDYNFKVGSFSHVSPIGLNYINDISNVHFINFINLKYPDDNIYKTGQFVDINKVFQTPYGKRGVNGVHNAFYYFEWWMTAASNYRCVSFNSNALEVNSDGSLKATADIVCSGGTHLTFDVVSQCHMHNPPIGASGIGFWWKRSGFVNPNDPISLIAYPEYQGKTFGTCILDFTPYGCNSTDHS